MEEQRKLALGDPFAKGLGVPQANLSEDVRAKDAYK
jgi:hypothetical protein